MFEAPNNNFEANNVRSKWSHLSYSFIGVSTILSLAIFVITLSLDQLDILRKFVLLTQVSLTIF